ncbi:MAG TPA: SDR family oxidoreductase [Gammaproteobacteria bacterium]|nr:SDR family oxidoreductase [Gammaproteobacteria bacterium]
MKKAVIHVREREPSTVIDNSLLAGKNVLVTGAGRNIGRSIALEMAAQGANVFFTDIDSRRCDDLASQLKQYQVDSRGFVSNVSKLADIDSMHDALTRDRVSIDILVHNAALHSGGVGVRTFDRDEWATTFETNVFGPLYLTKLVANSLIGGGVEGGCIIFLSSIHQWTVRSVPSYSASKAALGMIIKELATELAPFGIRVNGIAPGLVAEEGAAGPKYIEHALLHKSAIDPCYIGRAAVFLASRYFSEFTTGTVLKIDDGFSLFNQYTDKYPTAIA